VLITAGCLESARKTELTIQKSSDHLWNVHASNVDLETFVLAWAEKEGVTINEISEKASQHTVSAALTDVPFYEGVKVILGTKDFVYFMRDDQHKVLTNAEYDSLPPVTQSYEIPSRDFAYASGMVLKEMKNKKLTGSIDHEAKSLIFTGTWDEHDQIVELIDYWGDAEPLPDYPEMQWPENYPPELKDKHRHKSESISGHILVSEIAEIRYVDANRLAAKINEWIELDPAESIVFLRKSNALIFKIEESKVPPLKDIVEYLDHPAWFTSELQQDQIYEPILHDTETQK
jgi:hypothetical protein